MHKVKALFIVLFCLITIVGCDYKDITACSGELTQVSFDYLVSPTNGDNEQCWLQNLNESLDAQGRPQQQLDLVIQTQTDYEKYFGCSGTLPIIDFAKKTLLAGRYIETSACFVFDQSVYKDCRQNYFFNVQLSAGSSQAFAKIPYFAIIPKISNKSKVTVNVTYKKPCNSDSTQIVLETTLPSGDYHYGCTLKNLNDIDFGLADMVIIQTQADYEKYVVCQYYVPAIDFQKKTLLAGRYFSVNADFIDSENVYVNCNGDYFFTAHLHSGISPTLTVIYFFATIPKISSQSKAGISIVY